jgi:hypothetical protein
VRNRFHALCPYFAMFPESFAEYWIERTTKPGEVVLDPFCGRGTAPFQALLMGRSAIGNDINPVAYVITRAKTNAPAVASLRRRISVLESRFDPTEWDGERRKLPEFFKFAYQPATLRQILFLRDRLRWGTSNVDCMLAAITLGALHGESEKSPSYLSNQMPRTIATKPAYSVRWWKEKGFVAPKRDAFDLLRRLVAYRYASEPPRASGLAIKGDMRNLHRVVSDRPVRAVITSPPYLDITNFAEDQWLRLWFLGGPTRPTTRSVISRDDRHENRDDYWRLIGDMWRTLGQVLDDKSHVVIRIGGKGLRPAEIVSGLEGTSVLSGRRVVLAGQEVSPMQKRQTRAFRPGDIGLASEVDCHFTVR